MACMTMRNLDDEIKIQLRLQAARHDRSMEDEARDILGTALAQSSVRPANLVQSIRSRLEGDLGIDLEFLPREPIRLAPDFT